MESRKKTSKMYFRNQHVRTYKVKKNILCTFFQKTVKHSLVSRLGFFSQQAINGSNKNAINLYSYCIKPLGDKSK